MREIEDGFLDDCRREGDPDGEALVQLVLEALETRGSHADATPPARRLWRSLLERDAVPSELFPDAVRAFLAAPLPPPVPAAGVLRRGEALFAEHGPEILASLALYSLPAAYAANRGVRVLSQTGFLESHPTRRLVETTQMVVDVMRPGGLDPDGPGVRTARKVRLMHAAIRRLILARSEPAWDAVSLGMPINQEDLAGTLVTFAWLPLDALARIGVRIAGADRDAWVETWGLVGRLLGVREELIPRDAAEAEALTRTIQARQVRPELPNRDGRELTAALLAMLEAQIPVRALRFGPASLMRLFLPAAVADSLDVPRRPLADRAARAAARLAGLASRLLGATRLERRFFRAFNLRFIEAMLRLERGGKRPRFELPLSLRGSWQTSGTRAPRRRPAAPTSRAGGGAAPPGR
jgi:hypothetical protein